MKMIKTLILGAGLLASSGTFAAGFCGGGKILSIKEGGWNQNHFMITIDYSRRGDDVGGLFNGHIRFLNSLNPDRFKGIKALAYMAFAGNKDVVIYTTGGNCGVANDLTIYAPGS